MTEQKRAAAIFKWGHLYPKLWPKYQEWARDLYRLDRVKRGVEEVE